jgi:hypothetical protein
MEISGAYAGLMSKSVNIIKFKGTSNTRSDHSTQKAVAVTRDPLVYFLNSQRLDPSLRILFGGPLLCTKNSVGFT